MLSRGEAGWPGVGGSLGGRCSVLAAQDYMQSKRYKYTRLDGSSRISERRDMVEDFQTNSDIFVFLLSTRAGGLGINLTAADTVIFFDSDWNPTVDQQVRLVRRVGWGRGCGLFIVRMCCAGNGPGSPLGSDAAGHSVPIDSEGHDRRTDTAKGQGEERGGRSLQGGVGGAGGTWLLASSFTWGALLSAQIHRMVIQGGEFRPEGSLKPKEVVSLLLDDAEVETRCECCVLVCARLCRAPSGGLPLCVLQCWLGRWSDARWRKHGGTTVRGLKALAW